MDFITIEGVRPWDGRYEFDLNGRELTTREWGWIKRLSGYLPLTIEDGFDGADPELFAAFAAIALFRAEKISAREVPEVFDRIVDAPFGPTIRLEGDGKEREADPNPKSPANGNTSGDAGPKNSGTSDGNRTPTGTPALATSASVQARSEN